MRRALAAAIVALLATLGVACGGGSKDSTSQPAVHIVELDPYAVSKDDLPDGYSQKESQTEEGPSACLRPADDAEKQMVAQIGAAGLLGCQAVTYEHKAATGTDLAGTLALLFKDPAAAEAGLPLVRDLLVKSYRATGDAKVSSMTEVPPPVLGDQALPGVVFKVSVGEGETQHSIHLWRRGRVVDVFAVADFAGQVTPEAAAAIATKIDTRAAG